MHSNPNNALFDCPVVSRNHAELRCSPWQPPGRQVSITDKCSLHGTTVNDVKLAPNVAFTLKTGDVIKLGDTVSRQKGSFRHHPTLRSHYIKRRLADTDTVETHDAVSLTFKRLDEPFQEERPTRSPANMRGFHLPLDSDQSDFDSDDESASSESRDHSSANTTPEQSKMKPGSQEQPIDIDGTSATSSKIVNLLDHDEDVPPPKPARPRIVQDSVDPSPTLVPDSVNPWATIDIEAEEHVAPESCAPCSESEAEEELDEFYGPSIAGEWPSEDDCDLDSDAAKALCEVDENDESELDGEDWLPHLEPSPELGNKNEPISAPPKPLSPAEVTEPAPTATKPRYDPVRGSQPPPEVSAKSAVAHGSSQKPTSTYTYADTGSFGHGFTYPATDLNASSRWDVPPQEVSPPMGMASFGYIEGVARDFTAPSYNAPTFGAAAANLGFQPPFGTAPDLNFYTAPDQYAYPAVAAPAPIDRVDSHVTKDKISIENLVEDHIKPVTNTSQQIPSNFDGTASTAEEAICLSPTQPAGTKRKATEMEPEKTTEPESKKPNTVSLSTGPRQGSGIVRRPRKKQRRSMVRTVALETAKLVGYAGIGAAGFAAFLMSPYAQQAIDYLG